MGMRPFATAVIVALACFLPDQRADSVFTSSFLPIAFATLEPPADSLKIAVPALKAGERVVAGVWFERESFDRSQKPLLLLKLKIGPGYHIYALEKSLKSAIPTAIEVTLPKGVNLEGQWSAPEPEKLGGALVYRKEVVFRNRLLVKEPVPVGKRKAEIKVTFQACNEAVCWSPETLIKEIEFEVVKTTTEK